MAKKQRTPPAQPTPSSSSSEEEESSDEEQTTGNPTIPHPKKPRIQNQKSESQEESSDDEEDEDEDDNPKPVKKPTSNSSIPHTKKTPTQKQNSESEEESSDDEDDEDDNPQPVKKPTSNSSIRHPKKTPTQKQKSESEEESSGDEEDEDKKSEPVKKPTPSEPEPKSEKKMLPPSKPPIPDKSHGNSPIVRIWSDGDEIAILQAMLDHRSKNGCIELNATGVKDLHDSIRKSLSIDVDTQKFADKIKRMRKKYTGASKKGDKLKFPKAHDKTIYDLSNKIWGKKEEDDGFVVNGNSRGATVNKGKSLKREFPFIRDALGGNRLALEMLETVDVKKAGALEEKFKKHKAAEINLTWEMYKLLQ